MKKLILIFAICMSMTACGQRETVVYQQPAPAVVAQPVYVQNTDPTVGILAGMAIGSIMSNGMRYDGHNGYYDSHYRGPSRTVVVNKTVNNITVNKNVPARINNSVPVVSAPLAPVANNIPANSVKIKNPGDAAANAERIKIANQASLKADLQAKQTTRASMPTKSSGGFNSMSKSASSTSSSGSSRRN